MYGPALALGCTTRIDVADSGEGMPGVGDGDADGDALGDADGLALGDADGLPLGLALGLPDSEADGLALGEALGLPLGLADGDGDALGEPDGDALGEADGLGDDEGTSGGISRSYVPWVPRLSRTSSFIRSSAGRYISAWALPTLYATMRPLSWLGLPAR